ncbi:CTP pyrophosphohydrolase [compost metagenome]
MQQYVLGFAFSGDQVALILKARPAWQAGRLNGVGGKVEPGEQAQAAMAREFREETGVDTDAAEWLLFAVMNGPGFEVVCFRSELAAERFEQLQSCTDEQVVAMPLDNPSITKFGLSNVPWLLAAARDPDCGRMVLNVQYGGPGEDLASERLLALAAA